MSGPHTDMVTVDTVSFLGRSADGAAVELLDGISFSAKAGEITAIIGPSGGGKSTLIRLINRLTDPSEGRITIGGTDIATMDPLKLRRMVALVPQKPFMFEGTVLDNLQMPFRYRHQDPPAAQSTEVTEVLTLARLDRDLLERDSRSLSLGQQQRVGVARALITKPQVLLLDEPTSALDRRTSDELTATLREICHGRNLTMIMVTHDLRLTEKVADYCFYLEAGRILEQGRAAELLTHPATRELKTFLSEPSGQEG
ncbi:ATP-binding cassette domain-containing protein [Geomonas oryzisoli]|uniref:ATP-binding cassette domain-containing protein n=1 Tax=Geomonas oryzisoli TaxID=2847992 RepID=A0ABX8J0V0_9BACT|nr:ATP-binding cassette domain-containing protein [Geomonas oryzisoli]QWV91788.1 ATP-binding cassette domain-containing protein [Geomonas oryzisoli]